MTNATKFGQRLQALWATGAIRTVARNCADT